MDSYSVFLTRASNEPNSGFPNYGFNFKHFFTVLYTPFLGHSILNHHAKLFPTNVSKKMDSYSVVLARALNVPNSGFSNLSFNFKHLFSVL